MTRSFSLDARLEGDTFWVADIGICRLLLMNDSRWPWLILVPEILGAEEIHHLKPDAQKAIFAAMMKSASALERVARPTKMNTGALGNIVRQLHIHIIARNEADANWPGPVWGFGTRVPYEPARADKLITQLRHALA